MRTLSLFPSVLATLLGLCASAAAEPTSSRSPRTIRATRAEAPVLVDGDPSDAVWQTAERGETFSEREPVYGRKAPIRSTVQVAYDDGALYVLVRAKARRAPVIRTLRRDDAGIVEDDAITVRIDPNRDGRAAYVLSVNAGEAQHDLLVLDDGRTLLTQWDGVWEAKVREEPDGFVTEYRIPFSILGIQSGERHDIGFSVTRSSVSPSAIYDLFLPYPPQAFDAPFTYGTVTGIHGVRSGHVIEVVPHVVGSTRFDRRWSLDPRRQPNAGAGLDARVQTGVGSYAEASILTDFSHVAIDQVQAASDRFPLFYQEQRPFFVEGLGELQFGQLGQRQLVDTRRMGLDGDRVVPIAAAVKAYGRKGPLSYSAFDVQTLERLPDPRDPNDAGTPPENAGALRVRYAPSRKVWVGLIGAARSRLSGPGDHVAGGADAEVTSSDRAWSLYAFGTGASSERTAVEAPDRSARGGSAYGRLRYAGKLVRSYVDWSWSSEDFEPSVGYYSRLHAAEHYASLSLVPTLGFWGMKELQTGGSGSVATTGDYERPLRADTGTSATIVFDRGHTASVELGYLRDHVDTSFELFGFGVESGVYQGPRYAIALTTPVRRDLDASFKLGRYSAFGGRRDELTQGLRYKANRYVQLQASFKYLFGYLDQRHEVFSFGVVNGSLVLALSPKLSLDVLGRYTAEPRAERFGLQSRLRYRYLPGSDLFLVYRRSRPFGQHHAPGFDELTLKITYYASGILG